MYNQEADYDKINKEILLKLGKVLLRGLKSWLSPIFHVILFNTLVLLGVFFLVLLAYTYVFIIPKAVMEENLAKGKDAVSIFHLGDEKMSGWSEEEDQKLYNKYIELTEKWREGLTEYQQEQAEDYALSWGVLAAVDRVVGDSSFNPDIKKGEIIPQPEKHYEILKPEFTWKESTITRIIEWKEKHTEIVRDQQGNVSQKTEIVDKERTVTEKVMLLVSADTYEAGYTYEYETATNTTGTAGLNSKKITETKEVVKNVQETGPYYERLVDLLAEYDFSRDEMNLEFILELAATYDEDYQYSLEDRWLSLNASIDFTRSYFDSDIGTIIWPLDPKYKNISSPYGYRIHPILKKRKLHTGIDLPAPKGTPIYAIGNGYVVFSGTLKGYGKAIVIDHGKGLFSLYGHMSKHEISADSIVQTGDVIGYVGSTGYSTGNHLHYEIREVKSGGINYINPLTLYKLKM